MHRHGSTALHHAAIAALCWHAELSWGNASPKCSRISMLHAMRCCHATVSAFPAQRNGMLVRACSQGSMHDMSACGAWLLES